MKRIFIVIVLFFNKPGLNLTYDGHAIWAILIKIGIFCQNQCLNRRLYLCSTDVFPKKLTYDCSSALNDEVPAEKCALASKMSVSQ